jgi:hypothetical protein
MPEKIGWETILATALITSFFTSCITEPVKLAIQSWLKRRDLRRTLYYEISHNFEKLYGQITYGTQWADHAASIGANFAMGFRRLAYDTALKEPTDFYKLGHSEVYWLDLMYTDWQNVITGDFSSDDQRLSSARFAMKSVLHHMKNRHISKRLMFRMSKPWVRRYFRAHLPNEDYTQMPGFVERHFWRRVDRVQYWLWEQIYGPPAINTEL